MTGDNMKSEILVSQRTKPDGRQVRRMSKSSPGLENGKTDSSSKNDGGGGPLSVSSCQSHENVNKAVASEAIGEKIENLTIENVGDNIQNMLKQANVGNQEATHLKDMLILHLGMIQHQQQLLLAKDRLIRTLAAEKDALKCRLERMERRMSLLKQKGDVGDSPLPSDIPGVTPEGCLSHTVQHKTIRTPEKAHRRRQGEPKTPNRRNLNTPNKEHNTPGRPRNKSRANNNHLTNKIKKRIDQDGKTSARDVELRSKLPDFSPVKFEKCETNVNTTATGKVDLRFKSAKRKIDECGGIVKSDKSFYVPYEDFKDLDVAAKIAESPNRKKRSKVEVPKWRFHPVSNCYALEGTENMEDEIYLKRHQKSETDEKRRKRWDIQRIREQRMYEKLKSGRYGASSPPKNKKNEIVTSFGPILESAKYLEIAQDIPVNVLGYPLPLKKSNEFSLPWFDVAKREKEEEHKEREERQKQQQARFRKR